MNDKTLVVASVLIIAIFAMITYPEGRSENIITAITSGLFGIAVGKSLKE